MVIILDPVNQYDHRTIVFVASAVMLIGGLVVTVSQQAAFADPGGQPNITYCHIPPGNPDNRHEVTAGEPSVAAHIKNHGDYIGPCQPNPDPN
jgi:predicted cobalt transporter CbtA